jgi:single-strand DNA-binding protein
MNSVILIGRLTRDPELRYTSGTQTAMTTFTLAVNRPYSKNDEADFIRIVVYGRQAETANSYLSKGSQAAVQGRIQTGSYTKQDGTKVYTTDVIADRVEFVGARSNRQESGGYSDNRGNYQNQGGFQENPRNQGGFQESPRSQDGFSDPTGSADNSGIPEGFHAFDDEDDENIPF